MVVIEDAESVMELEPMEVEPVDKDNDPDDEGCVVEEVKASAPESNKKKKKKKTEQKPATFPVSADDEKEL